ncbi:unnamed protein product, partial [Rotaria sp. Silwood2]
AIEKLRANPADVNIIKEINNIHIKFVNLPRNILDSETASTHLEPSNDAQLSPTHLKSSNNEDLPENDSERLNNDNQNNSYFHMVRDRGFHWVDGLILGLIVCILGAYMLKQIPGRKTAGACIILFLSLVGFFIGDVLSKDPCKKRRVRKINPQAS